MKKRLLTLIIVLIVLVLILVAMGIFSFLNNNNKKSACSPELIGVVALKKMLSSQNYSVEKGAQKVIEKIKENKENPDDYYAKVQVVEKSGLDGSSITFHLSHKDDFKKENCNKIGNPSGKSRDMIYDTNQDKIISDLLWR